MNEETPSTVPELVWIHLSVSHIFPWFLPFSSNSLVFPLSQLCRRMLLRSIWWGYKRLWLYLSQMCLFLFVYSRAIVLTYQEHLGVTYITLNEDPCPPMLVHNKCPIQLLLKENVKGEKERVCVTLPIPSSPLWIAEILLQCFNIIFYRDSKDWGVLLSSSCK